MKQAGFTFIELMIALFMGAFILGGVTFTYMGMKITNEDTQDIGELQEAGRLAMDVLKRDIEMAGFWGNYASIPSRNTLTSVPANPAPDCSQGDNNATFPQVSTSTYKVIYGETVDSGAALGCISGAVNDSDVIQIKRVNGLDVTLANTNSNRFYFVAETQSGLIQTGTGAPIAATGNTKVWEYIHNAYYVADQTYQMNGKNVVVPTLMRKRLTSTGMKTESVMEGVENIRFVYGLDDNGDSKIDTYRTADQMTAIDWEQQTSVISTVQIFVLVRTLEEDKNGDARIQKFTLGGNTASTKREITKEDKYRRKLFVSTVRVMNVGDDKWSI